ncbi:uncharacterized protein RJT21DRAFT_33583 [Scheffersomyces amazonensis]|uniref:uncharacterized protein n=1 Tax=Scheffersomyces amazonensis TaxID=1078765 RepID=UPI00315D6F6D
MGSCDVKIEIDRSASNGTFTNYDIISGTVTLIVTNSISLNYIQVKLEGISKTELVIPRQHRNRNDRKEKDKIIRDIHKVLYDTQLVFPPDNVRSVSQAKEFTLTPGNYSYPFEFKLPLNNSCIKLQGITNKVSFNKKTLDLVINNGNFNSNVLRNKANQFLSSNGSNDGNLNHSQNYHITTQLPPSLSGIGEFANVKYFVKVTCKRSSFLKTNLRAFDPFIFLPLDLNINENSSLADYEEYKEVFVRKELIFRDRIPEIVGVKVPPQVFEKKSLPKVPYVAPKKPGFFQKIFDSPTPTNSLPPPPVHKKQGAHKYYSEIESKDVPFSFEVRFRHPAFLIPTKKPSFKLYLVSSLKPSRYTLSEYGKPDESNGLGIVYLQNLRFDLTSITQITVLEDDGGVGREIHTGKREENIQICNNNFKNLKFDLMHCKKLKSSTSTSTSSTANDLYELEIPKKYFENCVLPDYLSPSFKTCNITRRYNLRISAGFSSEKVIDFRNQSESNKKIKTVDLHCANIKVLSGLNMTSSLHSNASKSSLPRNSSISTSNGIPLSPPPIISNSSSSPLPSQQIIPRPLEKRGSSISYDQPQFPPNLPQRPSYENSVHSSELEDSASPSELPTYDDVILESSYQDNSEHIRARRRYQQHEQYYNNLE